jgi:hypothetical protein
MRGPVLRQARSDDVVAVAAIWREGWADGHMGHVPTALVAIRTPESFVTRATDRRADTTVAEVDGEIAGFVMVVGDEVEEVYVSIGHRGSGVAAVLLTDAARPGRRQRPPGGVAGRRDGQCASTALLRTAGLG